MHMQVRDDILKKVVEVPRSIRIVLFGREQSIVQGVVEETLPSSQGKGVRA
jgi:hypothetical protein